MDAGGGVVVCEMTREYTTWEWLCKNDRAARRAAGWTVKAKAPIDGRCADCETRRQRTQEPKEATCKTAND